MGESFAPNLGLEAGDQFKHMLGDIFQVWLSSSVKWL